MSILRNAKAILAGRRIFDWVKTLFSWAIAYFTGAKPIVRWGRKAKGLYKSLLLLI